MSDMQHKLVAHESKSDPAGLGQFPVGLRVVRLSSEPL